MKNTSFLAVATILASLMTSHQGMAQNLPDEINHPHYLKIYQNLEKVLAEKSEIYSKLSSEKALLVKEISKMEKDAVEIPARNNELNRLIEAKQQEISRIDGEIQGLEGVLGKIIEDLRRIDAMVAQLQRDLNEESARSQQIQMRRQQIAQDVAQLNARLEREVREENQSERALNRLSSEFNGVEGKSRELEQERRQLTQDVNRFKVEVKQARNTVAQNTKAIEAKKPQLEEAQAKIPGVKEELKTQEAQLSQVDTVLTPKKTKLSGLKAEMARRSPNITRLENENKTLTQKVKSNEEKIKTLNVAGLITKRDALENEISGVKEKIKENSDTKVALQEKIKPVLGELNELGVQLREAIRSRNNPEIIRLRGEIEKLNKSIETDQREIKRLESVNTRLALSIAPKQNEINTLNTQISSAESQVSNLQKEIETSNIKIAENEKKIAEEMASNADLAKEIAELEKEVKALEEQRAPIAKKVAALKQQEEQLSNQVKNLSAEIKKLETETTKLNASITEMEKAITEYPQNMKRIEAHLRQLDEKSRELRVQIDREQRLLARIRQDRIEIQRQRDGAQAVLNQVNADLESSQRLMGAINNKLFEEQANRDALTRYNQDSIRKLDNLRLSKSNAEQEIAGASEEIAMNDQDIATISTELPRLKNDLSVLSPKVESAETALNTARTNATNANSQYQNRFALYQDYLAKAQTMGAQKAETIASNDGLKAGAADAKVRATKLASESAALEGKWQALRRGYVRGEIAGFRIGFDQGLASSADARRGEEDGKVAGAKRAKNHADMVIKPQKYLAELERRLKEDMTSKLPLAAMIIKDEMASIQSMAIALDETIPDLTAAEINEAARIVSSLDELIAQSEIEIREILRLRKNIADARNVYAAPGVGENENNANCSDVYKNVKDFVEACKGSYVIKYQNVYKFTHANTFVKTYPAAFDEQIDRVYEAELNRLYNGYFKEASNVAKQVGLSEGKREIYQQSYNRAELAAYGNSLPGEISRVEAEAVELVENHLAENAALTLKGSAKLLTQNPYGIAPGAELDLNMVVKNIGSVASSGNSQVRIIKASSNLALERGEAPIASVAANSHSELKVMGMKVKDSAEPGSKVYISGEIIHPGNHYRSSRVESFEIESVLNIDPSVEYSVDMDKTPKVSGIFGTKKHEVDIILSPKYSGVEDGYEISLEEVGSSLVDFVSKSSRSKVLARGEKQKLRLVYKLSKSAKGQTIALKLTVKNNGQVVSQQDIQITAK